MDATISARINLMRIVLISGIIFVHVPYDPATSPYMGTFGGLDWLRVFLADSLFRIGVPCLSAISGYLLFHRGLAGFDYGKTLRGKASTILLPFLLWNAAFLAFVYIAQTGGIGFGYLPDVVNASPRELMNLGLAIETWPINIPLYFLRDLLLCLLLSPLIAFVVMRYPRTVFILMLAYAVLPLPNGIFLKKSILFGFSFGVAAALHRVDITRLDRFAVPVVLAAVTMALLLSFALYAFGPEFPVWLDTLRALAAIAGIFGAWALSALLIRTGTGQALSRLGGLSFWIFCGHYPLLILFWMVWNRLGIADYPLFYAASPALALAILVSTHAAARRFTPALAAILTGRRAGGQKRPVAGHPQMEPDGPIAQRR
ncbi:acyltransferase [Shinella sp. CPCC 101442]|uniref:acyltransferase family protein n=1 Tax=Shinella sp. CPCC 101442 TaxID=2932265 RepID=UPI00215250A9|nr:acyltransferase [Shinella sp. CPCC 101442]